MRAVCWLIVILGFSGIQVTRAQNALPPAADLTINYDQHVKPILAAKCFGCHGPRQQQSGLRLDLRQNALRGGDYGAVIVPGKSAESRLILRLVGASAGVQMPPTGPLSPDEISILRAWIDQGADMPGRASDLVALDRTIDPRTQALVDAIHQHDSGGIRKMIADDRSLATAADAAGATMLMHASYAGTIDTMQLLLDAGADVRAASDREATALHWAATDAAKVKLLLSKGADVNARTIEGRTALHIAAMQPDGEAVLSTLIEAGADVNAKSIVGVTPLFPAVNASLASTRLLLDKGANPNARQEAGLTPLMAGRAVDGAVALLIARGADVNARGKKNETALQSAANHGDVAAVTLLLDKGADVNVADARGYTALMLAAHYDFEAPEIIRLLLAHGADISPKADGESAVDLAAKRGVSTETVKLLRAAQAPRDVGNSHNAAR